VNDVQDKIILEKAIVPCEALPHLSWLLRFAFPRLKSCLLSASTPSSWSWQSVAKIF